MPKNKEIEVTLSLKDEASKKIQSARATIREFANATKDTLRPVDQLRSAWMKVGLTWGIVVGTMIKGLQEIAELNKEIKDLDISAIKLGVSTEQLSTKLYGFNIASLQARIGSMAVAGSFETMNKAYLLLKTKAAEAIGETNIRGLAEKIYNEKLSKAGYVTLRQQAEWGMAGMQISGPEITKEISKKFKDESRQEAIKQLQEHGAAFKEAEAIKQGIVAETQQKTRQLTLSAYKYKEDLLKKEEGALRSSGVREIDIAAYVNAAKERTNEDNLIEHRKQSANRLKIEGDTWAAMRVEQTNALIEYKRQFGDDGELVKDFIAGQEAMERQAKLTYLGLKNEFQIYHDAYVSTIHSMTATFSDVFYKTITGEIKSLSETMREFGRTVMKILSDMVANFVVTQAIMGIGKALGGLGGGSTTIQGGVGGTTTQTAQFGKVWSPYHFGGPVYAHAGLATDDIPVIARRGEGFLTQTGMANIGGADNLRRLNHGESAGAASVLQNFNFYFSGFPKDIATFKSMLNQCEKEIGGLGSRALQKNDQIFRGSIKRYGR